MTADIVKFAIGLRATLTALAGRFNDSVGAFDGHTCVREEYAGLAGLVGGDCEDRTETRVCSRRGAWNSGDDVTACAYGRRRGDDGLSVGSLYPGYASVYR